jgi:hypothetical protein
MAEFKQSDRVRGIVLERYVRPALHAGKDRLAIPVRDVLKDAEATAGFPRGRTPLICNVLQSHKLLKEGGLEIERVDGPPSKQSRTVVVHYRLVPRPVSPSPTAEAMISPVNEEDPAARAKRVVDGLRGLLKDEIAAYGGTEAFMRWVRSDEDEAA